MMPTAYYCPKCGPQYPIVTLYSVALSTKDNGRYICYSNMPYQGCGWRGTLREAGKK